jgi:plasmid stabilization system protein ParE
MRREIFISLPAQSGFSNALNWLTQDGARPTAWQKWLALRDAPDALLDFPYRGRPSPDFKGRRQLSVSGYRIIYVVHPDTGDRETAGNVFILAVLGPGQP